MTRIDFYVDAPDRAMLACRLAARALRERCRVLIFTPEEAVLARVDEMLWTVPPTSFVPHCRARSPLARETPVLLAERIDDPPHDDVLINLHAAWPTTFSRFRRLIEIVSGEDADKREARERFKFYRDRGYVIHTHKLGEER